MGKLFHKTVIKTDIDTCWDFFSSPENLGKITPPDMSFVITKFDGKKMYEGQHIEYTVKPFPFMKVKWKTEIRSVKVKKEFVDTQIKGPYKIWHHRHLFKEVEGGVEMIDMVHYALPFGFLNKFLEKLVVNARVGQIFSYREKFISDLFKKKEEKISEAI